MSGFGRVVVGYREHDRRRYKLLDEYGITSVAVRKCVAACGFPVYFFSGGIDAARDRDAEVICDECYQLHRDEVTAAL